MEEEKNLKLSQNLEYGLQIPVFCFHVENIKQTFFFINGPRGFLRGTQSVFDEFTHELYLYLQSHFKRRCLGGHKPCIVHISVFLKLVPVGVKRESKCVPSFSVPDAVPATCHYCLTCVSATTLPYLYAIDR